MVLLHTRDNNGKTRDNITQKKRRKKNAKKKGKRKRTRSQKDVAKKKKEGRISSNRNKHDIHTHTPIDREDPTEFTNNNSRIISHKHL